MTVQRKVAVVYYSPRANRRFLTLRAAIRAESRTIISQRYPRGADDEFTAGFHWHELHRSDVLFRRLCRLIKASMRKNHGHN